MLGEVYGGGELFLLDSKHISSTKHYFGPQVNFLRPERTLQPSRRITKKLVLILLIRKRKGGEY
jgi:hypothetical protein